MRSLVGFRRFAHQGLAASQPPGNDPKRARRLNPTHSLHTLTGRFRQNRRRPASVEYQIHPGSAEYGRARKK